MFFVYVILKSLKRESERKKKIKNDKRNSSIPKVIIAKFYLGGLLSLGIEWLENTNKYTKEEIYNFLNKLIPENIENI